MNRLILACLGLLVPAIALAGDVPAPKLGDHADRQIREAIPVCSEEMTLTQNALQHKLPINLTGTVVRTDSKRPSCQGQWVAATSTEGSFYIGIPWFLDEVQGTLEEKLKAFTWKQMQETFTPVVDRTRTKEGLYRVKLLETTERGKVPFEGLIDPAGTVFFFGHFVPPATQVGADRMKSFEPFLKDSPSTGAAQGSITVVEFSDFECPSCQHASTYLKPILAKYGDKVRYIRYDLPLVTMHPWALAAAVAGRAISHQKSELFWEYKEQVYANQEKLSAFTIDEFARNFAKDHELNLEKYDAEVSAESSKTTILDGAGAAFSNDVRATPTYMVNGIYVDPGTDGKALEKYVGDLIKK